MADRLSGTFLATTLLFTSPQTEPPRWVVIPSINEDTRSHTNQTLFSDLRHDSLTSAVVYAPATRVESDDRGKLLERIAKWKTLQTGWDGERSEAPIDAAINLATLFINALPREISLPKAMLSSLGEIGLYWDSIDNYIDLEFGSDMSFSAYFRDRHTGKERFIDNLSMSACDLDLIFKELAYS